MSRYKGRKQARNNTEMYEDILDARGVKQIVQYTTPTLKYPSEEEYNRIRTTDYVWKSGDKFWKLASHHYGDPRLWWIVAQFNRKPTEGHLEPGDVLKIPIELSEALGALT
jgi:nucleoid-associated protein YgaU